MLIANADVPMSPPPQAAIVRTVKTSADCQVGDMLVTIRRSQVIAFTPAAEVKCSSKRQPIELEIVDVSKLPDGMPLVDKAQPKTFCQSGITRLYLIKLGMGQGRTVVCAPKGVKAGIRG